MSAGKMSAQVSHASMAFLTNMIKNNTVKKYDNYFNAWEDSAKTKPQYYRHPDLNEFAKQARDLNQTGFFAKPKDLNHPYGNLILCEEE